MQKIIDYWRRARESLIDRFGDVYESTQFNNYWHTTQYTGPFEKDYDGKFCYQAPLDKILEDATKLKPFVRRNEIIGFKHRTSENKLDDPFNGQLPVMIVFSTHKGRNKVLEILRSIGVTDARWEENNQRISPLEISVREKQMNEQNKSSPYSV
ncbi:hypothetical protein HY837_00290 [archaeon]|nr:hypothetical protein [archaeon]